MTIERNQDQNPHVGYRIEPNATRLCLHCADEHCTESMLEGVVKVFRNDNLDVSNLHSCYCCNMVIV